MASTATEHYDHAYPLGNDVEAKRLRNQHDVIKDAMGGLVLAPLDFDTSPLIYVREVILRPGEMIPGSIYLNETAWHLTLRIDTHSWSKSSARIIY